MAVLRSLFSQVALQGVGAALSFCLVLALAATLGAGGYGIYAWVVSTGSIGAILLQAGLQFTILKQYAPLDLSAQKEPSPVSDTYTAFVGLTVLALAGAAVVSLSGVVDSAVVWAAPVALGLASGRVGSSILLSAGRPISAHFAENVLRVIFVLALLLFGVGLEVRDPTFYLFGYSLGALLASTVFLYGLLFIVLKQLWRKPQLIRPVGAHFHVSLAMRIANQLPVFITGFFVEPRELALLAVAIQLSGPVTFGQTAARYYYGAIINAAVKAGDLAKVRRRFRGAVLFSNAMSWPLSAALFSGMYLVMVTPSLSLADFEVTPGLLAVFGGVLLFRLAHAATGPSQLVAIFLGADAFVRNVNAVLLIAFALGLVVAARFFGAQAVAGVMICYAVALNGLVVVKLLRITSKKCST